MATESEWQEFTEFTDFQPKGPIFIDDEGCRCALQEELGTAAWRCTDSPDDDDIYSGERGKWFFATNQTDPASLQALPNSERNPPVLHPSYVLSEEGQTTTFEVIDPSYEFSSLDSCTGRNDTDASANFYRLLVTSKMMSPSPCWQPGIIAVAVQNASAWNATGCNLGFYCKCSEPKA